MGGELGGELLGGVSMLGGGELLSLRSGDGVNLY